MKKLLYPECIMFYVVLAFIILGNWIASGLVSTFDYFGLIDKGGTVTNPADAVDAQIYLWIVRLSFLLLVISAVLSIWRMIRKTQ